ncbi:ferritin-like domain-containing protein [Actinomadura sp. 7K534]|uniref:ferritin-like domain-containing protein n=1 Tax=Actinomadura sp. 7K534 TaxID=2530366 RepID=UPI001FB75663|nr:ferritin-like domain-containing protein [Actinomadura sp. 7K534]
MPEAVPRLPGAVSRRALLGRGAVLGGAALLLPAAGCAAETRPHKDVPTLAGAIASEQNLVATYEAAKAADASLAARLDLVLAHHREHLAVLKRHYVPGSGDRADEGGAIPAPSALPLPDGGGLLDALRDAEDRAAQARTADAAKAAPALAQLLASIGACEAGHAMLASGEPPPVRSKSGAEAVRTALGAEHAAVYGYGVLGARLRGSLRMTATAVWNDHRARRDALVSILSDDSGEPAEPIAGAAAYRLPVKVTSARSAARLAAALEDDLVPAYVALAGASSPDLRAFAADGARRARARSAAWRSKTGLPAPADAFPGLPPAARSPRPVPGE